MGKLWNLQEPLILRISSFSFLFALVFDSELLDVMEKQLQGFDVVVQFGVVIA